MGHVVNSSGGRADLGVWVWLYNWVAEEQQHPGTKGTGQVSRKLMHQVDDMVERGSAFAGSPPEHCHK